MRATYWKVMLGGVQVGIVARCEYCNRLLDGHWLNGYHDIMLAFMMANYEEGGCDACTSSHRPPRFRR